MLLVLLGAALHATWNAGVKSGRDKFLDAALVLAGAAVVIPGFLLFLPLPDPACWPLLGFSVVIHLIYFVLVALAYEHGEMSLVYPLMRGAAPVLTALLGVFFLEEIPNGLGWLGILCVSGGILSLAFSSFGSEAFRGKGVAFALLNAGVIVIYTLVDGAGVRLSGNAMSYTGWMIFLTAVSVVGFVACKRGSVALRYLAANRMKALAGGCCTFGSYSLALWAMTRAPIAHVATLRETSIVFGTILAAGILKEKVSRRRLLGIAAVTIGAVLIKMS